MLIRGKEFKRLKELEKDYYRVCKNILKLQEENEDLRIKISKLEIDLKTVKSQKDKLSLTLRKTMGEK